MTPDEIRAAIQQDPQLTELVPDSAAIAARLSADRYKVTSKEIGNGMILATIGLADGNILLDALNSMAELRHIKPLLERGGLDVSNPLVTTALDAMVGAGAISRVNADKLIALAHEPDPVPEIDVRRAIWGDNGEVLIHD